MNSAHNMLPRYAGKGFAIDCLTTGVQISDEPGATLGLPVNYTYLEMKQGIVTCPTGASTLPGALLAAILVFFHMLAVMVPIISIAFLYFIARERKGPLVLKRLGLLLSGIGCLAISSFGEISQHIHDNWLYFGLYSSWYNTVFHSSLCLGQVLLAYGMGGFDRRVVFDFICWAISTVTLVVGTFRTANEKNPVLYVHLKVQQLLWPIVFSMLTLTTISFVAKCFRTKHRSKGSVNHIRYTVGVTFFYIVGVIAGGLIASTGNQWWHALTASNFVLGYITQLMWIRAILKQEVQKPKSI